DPSGFHTHSHVGLLGEGPPGSGGVLPGEPSPHAERSLALQLVPAPATAPITARLCGRGVPPGRVEARLQLAAGTRPRDGGTVGGAAGRPVRPLIRSSGAGPRPHQL